MKYFLEYAVKEVQDTTDEVQRYDLQGGRHDLIYNGGLHIYTTLDTDVQASTEEAVYNYENLPTFPQSPRMS